MTIVETENIAPIMHSALNKGTFLLSLDTELAWGGVHDRSFASRRHMYEGTRAAISRLIELIEDFEIRATWAVVGHLFLGECTLRNGRKHPEIIRPSYKWFSGDWFEDDPVSDAKNEPYWYGPDIIEAILKCKTKQEVGSHGFSHTIVGDSGCSKEAFESELDACKSAAKSWGIDLESFVFPRNSIGHLESLMEKGFTSFRGTTAAWYRSGPSPIRKLGRFVESAVPFVSATARPVFRQGIWDLPGTAFYLHRSGWTRYVPIKTRVSQAHSGIDQAIREKSLYHLWFHPFNLASDPEPLLSGLEQIFRRVAEMRDVGMIDNPTMNELTKQLNSPIAQKETVL